MSPIYEEEGKLTREELHELRRYNKCKECGARLDVFMDFDSGKAFLACTDWLRTHHEGIEREASRYEKEGLASLNIPTRREMMEQEYGKATTKALDKYMGVVSLTKPQVREIILAVYPDTPAQEVARAVLLCATYGLNPLMKHVFLIPFNEGKPNETWITVIGIKAKRLLASRRGNYSYVDNTPRVMTEQEQRATFGEVYKDRICVITKVKDPATGAEAPGYGFYLEKETCFGADKGNSRFNMAAIRSESQALDRLRPGEMPQGVEVIAEEYASETALISLPEGDGKIGEAAGKKGGEGKPDTTIFSTTKQESKKIASAPPAEPEEETFHIDMDLLNESLKEIGWSHDTAKSWLSRFKIDTHGTLEEVISRLTRKQAEEFVKTIQEKVAQKQMEPFL